MLLFQSIVFGIDILFLILFMYIATSKVDSLDTSSRIMAVIFSAMMILNITSILGGLL